MEKYKAALKEAPHEVTTKPCRHGKGKELQTSIMSMHGAINHFQKQQEEEAAGIDSQNHKELENDWKLGDLMKMADQGRLGRTLN